MFDGVAVPLLYVREDQINAVVPFSCGRSIGQAQVEYQGKTLNSLMLPVRALNPGIFRLGSTEFGAILNQDNTVNTPGNPAARGSVITFWTTGMGLFENAYTDGAIIGAIFVSAPARGGQFAGHRQPILYAGASPDMVAGVAQMNVRIAWIFGPLLVPRSP